jgi:hypothetical protein
VCYEERRRRRRRRKESVLNHCTNDLKRQGEETCKPRAANTVMRGRRPAYLGL